MPTRRLSFANIGQNVMCIIIIIITIVPSSLLQRPDHICRSPLFVRWAQSIGARPEFIHFKYSSHPFRGSERAHRRRIAKKHSLAIFVARLHQHLHCILIVCVLALRQHCCTYPFDKRVPYSSERCDALKSNDHRSTIVGFFSR